MVSGGATDDCTQPLMGRIGVRTPAAEWWLVALLSSAFVLLLVADRTTRRTDSFVYDLLIGLERREPDPRIFLVNIDSPSLAEFGPWPWPRDIQARLVAAIGASRPRAIAYDVLLLEPTDPEADAALGRAIGEAGQVFLPLLVESPGLNGARFHTSLPIPVLAKQTAGTGHINLIADPDGIFRRIHLSEGHPAQPVPHLMELMRRSTEPARERPRVSPLLIPFTGPPGNFPAVSASAILRGELPPELLRDRLVIVGATAEGLGDRYPTSHGRGGAIMSGIEIQANVLDGLLSDRMIREGGFAARAVLALAPLWVLLAAFRMMRPSATARLLVLLLVLTAAASALALLQFRVWIPPFAALVGLAIVYPLWGWRRLAAVSASMLRQLERLGAEPDALTKSAEPVQAADPVTRQTLLLDAAIARHEALRRFVTESLRQLPDAILVLDDAGRLLLANAAADRLMTRLAIRETQPSVSDLLAKLRPDPEAPQGLTGWPTEGETSGGVRGPDGRHYELRIAPRTGEDGTRIGWIVQLSDDSEVWLSRQRREEMMHFLSHDMRSPQASILAVLSTVGEGAVRPDVAERIESYARRTLNLADGLVQLARAESLDYQMAPVDLSDALLDAVDDLWPQLRAKGMTIDMAGEDQEWIVSGERSLLTRAIINLIDNAVKFSPEGSSVHCVLEAREAEGRQMAVCAVTDQGRGIPSDQLCTLFERFKRSPAHQRDAGGIGLGLAFVQTVAVRHDGWVRCASEPGRGSTFTLAVPLAPS